MRFHRDSYKKVGCTPVTPSNRAVTASSDSSTPLRHSWAAMDAEQVENLRLYSDPTGLSLKQSLAGLYDLKPENIIIDGFGGCVDTLCHQVIADCVCVLWVFLGSSLVLPWSLTRGGLGRCKGREILIKVLFWGKVPEYNSGIIYKECICESRCCERRAQYGIGSR